MYYIKEVHATQEKVTIIVAEKISISIPETFYTANFTPKQIADICTEGGG